MPDLLNALRRLAGSVTASNLGGCNADAVRAATLVREAGALVEVVEQPSTAIPPTVLAAEPQDDIERTVRSVTAAAAAYAGAFQGRRSPDSVDAPHKRPPASPQHEA